MANEWQPTDADTVWESVVVGGGMVGAATALGLAQKGFSVVLVEKQMPTIDWDGQLPYQTRVSALTRASENILRHLGAWSGVENRRAFAFTDMHVWESISKAEVHFAAQDVEEPNLGYVVENQVIQAALWEQVMKMPNITILVTEATLSLTRESGMARLTFGDDIQLKTRLVVGADGAFSSVRQAAGIELDEMPYDQCAVVGCVKTELSHQQTCWQRYQAEGPFAFLGMADHISSIAWYLPLEKMDWAMSLDEDAFAAEITAASDQRLGKVVEVMARAAFPLVRRHAEQYVKPNLVLVGDAAHTIHPQAGQGVNLGLLDAAALIEVLASAKNADPQRWFRLSVLRRYERWRRGDNAIVQRSMEGFDWLFKQENEVKNQLRKWLLPIANEMPPAKNWLMRQALNGRLHLPVLAQDVKMGA